MIVLLRLLMLSLYFYSFREELWDLPQNASLSACLLLLITAGAVVGSVIYEKRVWCRYFCPIGAMNKIFAMVRLCS